MLLSSNRGLSSAAQPPIWGVFIFCLYLLETTFVISVWSKTWSEYNACAMKLCPRIGLTLTPMNIYLQYLLPPYQSIKFNQIIQSNQGETCKDQWHEWYWITWFKMMNEKHKFRAPYHLGHPPEALSIWLITLSFSLKDPPNVWSSGSGVWPREYICHYHVNCLFGLFLP